MNILTSYHPALLAMQALYDQFPGAEDFYLFSNDEGVRVYHSKGNNQSIFTPVSIEQADMRPQLQKFRKTKKELIWGEMADLPIEAGKTKKGKYQIQQLSIQDEIEQNVLIFRIASPNDDAFDVFAIKFSKTFSNFYIPSGRNALSSDLKKSIGKTIRRQIQWLYDLHKNQSKNIKRIQHAYQQHADEIGVVQQALDQERITNRDLLEKYLKQLILKHEEQLDCRIVLKAGFLDKIKESELPIELIQETLNEAVLTAYDLALDPNVIQLTPNLIQLKEKRQVQVGKSIQLLELDKTEALLDRYEHAARQLEQKSQRINGRNLAQELNISGPAITDAIKKHGKKIKRLLEKSPVKWPLLCDFIKPIREIKWALAASE